MILLIDHYDSFTNMIADYITTIGYKYQLIKTDDPLLDSLSLTQYSHIIIGPGPGHPLDSCLQPVYKVLDQAIIKGIPTLGICLGHQIIATKFGYQVKVAAQICHGKVDKIEIGTSLIFNNLPTSFKVTRYHSLIVIDEKESNDLWFSAYTPAREIMALEHRKYKIYGVQFHPESIMTEYGHDILSNFLTIQ